jgi:hypothetical protein
MSSPTGHRLHSIPEAPSTMRRSNSAIGEAEVRYTADVQPAAQPGPRAEAPAPQRRSAQRPAFYVALLVVTMCVATGYKLRTNGLLSCDASGYGADRYVAYCQASAYGDYDYGAFWYGLEPATINAASNADVLFVGNSRAQFALSSNAIANWFESHLARYYLLGFAYNGNMAFAAPLLHRLKPRAKVYVVSVDLFFRRQPTPPAQEVMRDSVALGKYRDKNRWQSVHRALCTRIAAVCRRDFAYYRRRTDGGWIVVGDGGFKSRPVVYSDTVDHRVLDGEVALGREFVAQLPISRECVFLTLPAKGTLGSGTSVGTAKAIAAALDLPLIAPQPEGLMTFDGSHVDRPSAERWSSAFIEAAGPSIEKCLRPAAP